MSKFFGVLAIVRAREVAFYGSVYPTDLKEKDAEAKQFIEALEKAGDCLSIGITGENNHYHYPNSMIVEVEFESESDVQDLPARLKIARPVLREKFEDYMTEKVKEISRELEKSGYAEIEYRQSEEAVRTELPEREHLYEKDGTLALREFEFYEWLKSRNGIIEHFN